MPQINRITRVAIVHWLVIVFAGISSYGCNGFKSRYAMSDPVYAEKYAEGAERGDLLGKAKQAVDARHVKGLSGWFLAGGTQYRSNSDSVLGGGDFGFEYYPSSWFSQRAGLAAYWGDDDGYLGLDAGLRAQLPARVTPFVGAGVLAGASRTVKVADQDGLDNDDDDAIDELGETKGDFDDGLFAVYPEIGMHTWLNGKWRVSGFGRYLVTDGGREDDTWLIGGQLTYFPPRPNFRK